MLLLAPSRRVLLRSHFMPERPGPLIGLHVLQSGHGAIFVDRWPDPRAILSGVGGNYSLAGDPAAVDPAFLAAHIRGFIEASEAFLPVLQEAYGQVQRWERIILDLPGEVVAPPAVQAEVRPLTAADAYHLWGLSDDSSWIGKTWGGAPGAAASGMAWGAFVDGRLASVAITFFVGERYEDIGVVTEEGFRGRGLSFACTSGLAREIQARGRIPSWTTDPANHASRRVAEKIGCRLVREDFLYVAGISIPEPPRAAGS